MTHPPQPPAPAYAMSISMAKVWLHAPGGYVNDMGLVTHNGNIERVRAIVDSLNGAPDLLAERDRLKRDLVTANDCMVDLIHERDRLKGINASLRTLLIESLRSSGHCPECPCDWEPMCSVEHLLNDIHDTGCPVGAALAAASAPLPAAGGES